MNVSSFAELLHLHGYGLYVWPAYAAMLGALLLEPWLIRRRLARARLAARESWRSTQFGEDGASAWSQTRQPEELR